MKKYLKHQANLSSANTMETGDHSKNGAIPKSLTSRGNCVKKMNLSGILLLLSFVCFSGVLSAQTWQSFLSRTKEYVNQTYDNGDSYKGQLNSVIREGLGAYYYRTDGGWYFGSWKAGKKSGYGIYLCAEGYNLTNCNNSTVYVGDYDSDSKWGNGSCYDKSGNLVYYGRFSNGKPTEIYPSTGDYSEYKFQILHYSEDRYIGETKDGKPHGYGIYVWSKADMWFGNWKDGGRSGLGIYLNYNASWSTLNCQNNDCQTLASYTSGNNNSYAHKDKNGGGTSSSSSSSGDTGTAKEYFEKGNKVKGNSPKQAIEYYKKAIDIDPNYVAAYNNMGIAYYYLENCTEAIRCFKKAIDIDPNFANAYFYMGMAYVKIENYTEAIRCYKKTIDIDPNDAYAYYCMGNAYSKLGNTQEADKCYEKVLELDSDLLLELF